MWLGCLNLGLESWRERASAPWALPFVRSTREDGARLGSRAADPHADRLVVRSDLGNSRPGLNQNLWDTALLSGNLRRRLRNSHTGATELPGVPARRVPRTAGSRMPKASLISIVEDDPFFRESMRRFMRSLGYNAEAFPSAADFLASPRLAETGCLIADVHMPAMSGPELHRHLMDAGYAIPTILVTAYPDDDVRARALKDGVIGYLRKPIDENHLMRCLRAALQSGEPPEEKS